MAYSLPRILAHAIASRDAYEKVSEMGIPKGFPPDTVQIWKALRGYYENDPEVQRADIDTIFDRVCDKYPRYEEQYRMVQEKVREQTVSYNNFVEDLTAQLRSIAADEIVQQLNGGNWEKAKELFDLADQDSQEREGVLVYDDVNVDDVIDANDPSGKTQLTPSILNDYVKGGVPSPCHILVFARPDMGKTTFMLNLVKGFCAQGKRVLYYSNEDNPQTFLMRSFTVFCGVPEDKIRKYPQRVREVLENRSYHNMVLAMSEEGSLAEINRLCEQYNPDVLIVDQLRNLAGHAESRVLQLEQLARGVRTLTRRHNLIGISVSQAGDSAINKSYLGQEDLDYSKTGVQGAVDLMVGLGASEQDLVHDYVCVAFPKNKFQHIRFGPKLKINYETGVFSGE